MKAACAAPPSSMCLIAGADDDQKVKCRKCAVTRCFLTKKSTPGKPHHRLRARQARRSVIEHSVTADMPDGQSLPPFIEDGVVWRVVHRDDGRTLWRRISIQTTAPFCPSSKEILSKQFTKRQPDAAAIQR